jgi:hypothetical protein
VPGRPAGVRHGMIRIRSFHGSMKIPQNYVSVAEYHSIAEMKSAKLQRCLWTMMLHRCGLWDAIACSKRHKAGNTTWRP